MIKRFIIIALTLGFAAGCASNTVKWHPNGQIAEAPKDMAMFLSQQQMNMASLQAEQSFDVALGKLADKLDFKNMAEEAERQIAEVFEERAESSQIREAIAPYRIAQFQKPYQTMVQAEVRKRQMWFGLAAIPLGQLPYYIQLATGNGLGNNAGGAYEIVDSFNGWSSSGPMNGGPGVPGAVGPEGQVIPGAEGGSAGQQNRPNSLIFGNGNSMQQSGFAPAQWAEKQVFDQGVLQDSDGQVDINLPGSGTTDQLLEQ